MAEKRAGLIMQAEDTMESEEERMEAAEGNGSDEETGEEQLMEYPSVYDVVCVWLTVG